MPTSVPVRSLGRISPMGLAFPPSYRPDDVFISPFSLQAIATELVSFTGGNASSVTAYPAANRVLAYPFQILDDFTVQKVWWLNGGTAATDTVDVGVYTEDGAERLVSGGGTTAAGASVVQEVNVTDTVLSPGRYWCAYIQSGVTATPATMSANSVALLRCYGVAQQAGASGILGTTFTPAVVASAVFPIFGIADRTQVA